MKKFGFTLAETLVALAIVGVVSALTIPQLATNHQKNVCAAALSVAVSDFESAISNLMTDEEVNDFFQTTAAKNIATSDVIKLLDTIELTGYTEKWSDYYSGITVKDIAGNSWNVSNDDAFEYFQSEPSVLETKKGITYWVAAIPDKNDNWKTEANALSNGVSITKYVEFAIDVNGKKKPNIIGRDIFFFLLGSDGILYPAGGRDYAYVMYNDATKYWNLNTSDCACTDSTKKEGYGCTARLLEHSYKVDY